MIICLVDAKCIATGLERHSKAIQEAPAAALEGCLGWRLDFFHSFKLFFSLGPQSRSRRHTMPQQPEPPPVKHPRFLENLTKVE